MVRKDSVKEFKTRQRKKQKTDVTLLTGGQHDVNNLGTEINPRNINTQETKINQGKKNTKKRSAKKRSASKRSPKTVVTPVQNKENAPA